MRLLILALACAVAAPACSGTPTRPTPSAAITVRAPSQATVRNCDVCTNGDLEVAADLIIEETAGVAGAVTSIDIVLIKGSTVLAGPGQHGAAAVTMFAGGTNRVAARGSLTIRSVPMHFNPVFVAQLPATYSMQVTFRDDNGHTLTQQAIVEAVQR